MSSHRNHRRKRHNRYSRRRSLWEHSKPFRQLSYWTMFMGLVFLLGMWSSGQQKSLANTSVATSTTATTAKTSNGSQLIPAASYQPAVPAHVQSQTGGAYSTPSVAPVAVQTAQPVQNSLDNYPRASKTLGDNVNYDNQRPRTGFDAYYMNEDDPSTVIAQENVAQVAINYAYSDFHGIPSEKFLGYWIGKLRVPQDGLYELSGNLSWSNVRVLIDKHIIVDTKNSFQSTAVYLTKGEYTVEVEYNNNWHTVGFQFNIKPYTQKITAQNLHDSIASLGLPANTVVYAASVYESRSRDNRLTVQTPSHENRPYILLLSSYKSVNWEVVGANPPSLILYGPKSNVRATGLPSTLVADYSIYYRTFGPNSCRCTNGHFHCESNELTNPEAIVQNVKAELGYPLVGFTGEYSAEALSVPALHITRNLLNKLQLAEQERAAQKQACVSSSHRRFEDMVK